MRLSGLDALAKQFKKMIDEYEPKLIISLNVSGTVLEKEAKDKFGYLQPNVGNLPAWAELSDSTKRDKEKKGFVTNSDFNPLVRTGDLRDSIKYDIISLRYNYKLRVGSTSEIMVYQEEGTHFIPPRPVLSTTMFQSLPVFYEMLNVFGKSVLKNSKLKASDFKNSFYHAA